MSEKKGFFARLREGMSKSREQIAAVTEDALQADAPIDEDLYDALLDAMILSDMGAACAEEALEKLRETVKVQKLHTAAQAKTALKEILVGMLEVEKPVLKWPMVILMVGVNGVARPRPSASWLCVFRAWDAQSFSARPIPSVPLLPTSCRSGRNGPVVPSCATRKGPIQPASCLTACRLPRPRKPIC